MENYVHVAKFKVLIVVASREWNCGMKRSLPACTWPDDDGVLRDIIARIDRHPGR